MASIGGLLGTAGGAGGTGFSGPGASGEGTSGIYNPTTAKQIDTAYQGSQDALKKQQDLLAALQGQQGFQNQSDVYKQLQDVAAGRGPNPAQAQLANATGNNIAAQSALMAGQRGSNANAGLIARQAALQGGNIQQQAAGQGAALQAQQSLNAMSGAGNLANTMAGQQIGQTNTNSAAQQAEQAALINAQLGVNNSNVGMQSNINNVNGQLANTQLQGQQGLIGGAMNAFGSMMAEGGEVNDQSAEAAPQSTDAVAPVDSGNEFVAPTAKVEAGNAPNGATPTFGTSGGANMQGGGKDGGGILKKVIGMFLAEGGTVSSTPDTNGPKSAFGKFLGGVKPQGSGSGQSTPNYGNPGANQLYQGMSSLGKAAAGALNRPSEQSPMPGGSQKLMSNAFAKGGKVQALVSPGEQYLQPEDVNKVAKGANPLKVGERIPGKPKHPGNDYRNDIVPKTLKEGGIVIPNKVMQSKNPHWEALKFVKAHMAKNKKSL